MSQNRYPLDTPVTLENFKTSGWESIISSSDDCLSMSGAFLRASKDAASDGRFEHSKVLELLAYAYSWRLEHNNFREPSKPKEVSAPPKNFTDDDIVFFSEIVGAISNNLLKGIISDIVWIRKSSLRKGASFFEQVNFALTAIDSYIKIPFDGKTMFCVVKGCWSRAIALSRSLNGIAKDRLQEITEKISCDLESAKVEERKLCFCLASLLIDNNLEVSNLSVIAEKFEQAAYKYHDETYVELAKKMYKILSNSEKKVEMIVLQAECIAKRAEHNLNSLNNMAAICFYKEAIRLYRNIPKIRRAKYGVDTRISKLRALCTEAGKGAVVEMNRIQTQRIEISKMVEAPEQLMRGKTTQEALLVFADLPIFVNANDAKKAVTEQIEQYPAHVSSQV